MKFILPIPPSLNRLYRMTCRNGYPVMYKSKEGKDWVEQATWDIKKQTRIRKPITVDCILYVTIYKKRITDCDNFLKASQDVLETAGVIKNDRQISELHVYRHKAKNKEFMELQIETWE